MPVTTIYPYQVRFVINWLIRFAEFEEARGSQNWHDLASAAACIERILEGQTPADAIQIARRLEKLTNTETPPRVGNTYVHIVSLAEAIIDGHRLGLLAIQRETQRRTMPPIWIGIDMATGSDRTSYGRAA